MKFELNRRQALALAVAAGIAGGAVVAQAAEVTLLNVSYDPTRELYQEFNAAFAKHWKEKTGDDVTIKQSHGGSGKQARAVIDGLEADVVTLALAGDVDAAAQEGRPDPRRLAEAPRRQLGALHLHDRLPRPQGQPQGHQGLGRPRQGRRRRSITPNPKTSGGARWNYLAAWGYAAEAGRRQRGKGQGVRHASIYKNTKVLDTRAHAARTTTFAERGIGDVLISWENEAHLAIKELGPDKFEIVDPVDLHPRRAAGHRRRQERRQARHPQGRRGLPRVPLLARGPGHRRQALLPPARCQGGAEKYKAQFPPVTLFTIDEVFGGWAKAQKTHFKDGGIFDQIYPAAPQTRADAVPRGLP